MSAVEFSSTVFRNHRRGLKVLFQPLFPRQPGLAPAISSSSGGARISLPEDILRVIIEDLSPNDILSISLTSRHLRILLIPELYRTVHLRSSRSCQSGLLMLAGKPELCAHIQKLAVRPNYYLSWPTRDLPLSEDWVAMKISDIATMLTNLRTFDWDGLEMPRDGLWLTLRNSCPDLKEIFSNVGLLPLDPESELFKFDDLTNFSLSVRHGLRETEIFPLQEDLPRQLWDMILTRCPNLTELTLCSFSASRRLFNMDRVAEGRWPALSSLTLGAFGYNSDFTLAAPPEPAFTTFLAMHPTLTYIRFAWNFKRWMSPEDPMALAFPPALESFSGIMQQLPDGGCSNLTTLDLMSEPLYATRAPALCSALRVLPMLTNLELWVHVPEPRAGHEAFFRGLWGAAPGLEDLHFMCTTAFGKKPLSELARALRLLPRLQTFALTKGHRYADESMRRSALRVFSALLTSDPGADSVAPRARLSQVSIRWARAACRNHLKQEGTYERVPPSSPPPSPPSSAGASRSRRRPRGGGEQKKEVVLVEAWERGLRAVGGSFERRYQFALPQAQGQPQGGDADAGAGIQLP